MTLTMSITGFEAFEQHFLELVGEYQSLSTSETRLREALRVECNRAEVAEAARAAAERATAEASSSAAAATASATQAVAALAKAQDELTAVKMQLELTERQRVLVEEKYSETTGRIGTLEKELQQLRPLQTSYSALQRQYIELQDRIRGATEEAKSEASRLESELRRVEKCASAGSEIRERARLAAAAHSRERRLAAAELQHTTRELLAANAQISKLSVLVAELQFNLANFTKDGNPKMKADSDAETLAEVRAALEAEQAGTARLERALAAAVADNATLAAHVNSCDNATAEVKPASPQPSHSLSTNICAIDSFLAE